MTVDYEACGYEAVRYLAGKGCREIGMINGSMKLSPCKGRYEGYKKALKESEIRVPEEVRLISLTGDVISGMLETSMTSLEMPAHEMGVKAADMIIEEIEAPSDQKPTPQHLVFSSRLVERESS